jgi:agmatine deiminase
MTAGRLHPKSKTGATLRALQARDNAGGTRFSERLRMPAEWEPHAATWLAWPHNQSDWPGKFEPIPWVYAAITRQLVRGERVEIIVKDVAHQAGAKRVLRLAEVPLTNIGFHRWPTNRGWVRDCGPMFARVLESEGSPSGRGLAVVDWHFNAWAKYDDFRHDRTVAGRAARTLGLPLHSAVLRRNGVERPIVLEGGAIDVNGRGTLVTTRECLLSRTQQRNPGVSQRELERAFERYLGISNVIWLKRGIVGDDTHGHVDDIARFVDPHTVVAAVERHARDANHKPLAENLAILRAAKDQDGRRLRVVELPMPAPVIFRNQRLPASYANFYIANDAVLVPVFNDPNDRVALNVLAELFPSRRIVPIYCGDLIWGLGAIHCMTQQQPTAGND